mmetsp:Transcript_103699/g.324237  ORF Transcript_103699/g.324237 Transcript_103699/m.324237 type:complete len:246 (+) Transcript_103699:227-964(+)
MAVALSLWEPCPWADLAAIGQRAWTMPPALGVTGASGAWATCATLEVTPTTKMPGAGGRNSVTGCSSRTTTSGSPTSGRARRPAARSQVQPTERVTTTPHLLGRRVWCARGHMGGPSRCGPASCRRARTPAPWAPRAGRARATCCTTGGARRCRSSGGRAKPATRPSSTASSPTTRAWCTTSQRTPPLSLGPIQSTAMSTLERRSRVQMRPLVPRSTTSPSSSSPPTPRATARSRGSGARWRRMR